MFLNPIRQYKLRWLVFILLLWIVTGLLTSIYEYFFLANYPGVISEESMAGYSLTANTIAAGVWGFLGAILFGVLEMFVLTRFLERRPFYVIVTIKLALYGLLLVMLNLLVSYLFNVFFAGRGWLDQEVFNDVREFLFSPAFWHPMLPFLALVLLTLFLLQISQRFGQGDLGRLVRGKYFEPKEEDRFFMFLDMKDSTTIAEVLGHQKFFALLNDFFHDITDSILNAKGEIYQYVGDEVIISWTHENGVSDSNCVRCFFDIEDAISQQAPSYLKQYGMVPEFKSGVHFGTVTIGEIGRVKKSVTYSGDVLNTTSRIQYLCNEFSETLIVTSDILEMIEDMPFSSKDLGKVSLKGKQVETSIYAIRR